MDHAKLDAALSGLESLSSRADAMESRFDNYVKTSPPPTVDKVRGDAEKRWTAVIHWKDGTKDALLEDFPSAQAAEAEAKGVAYVGKSSSKGRIAFSKISVTPAR